jgi:hypothetical protein
MVDPFVGSVIVSLVLFSLLLRFVRLGVFQVILLALPFVCFFLNGFIHFLPSFYVDGVSVGVYEAFLISQAYAEVFVLKKRGEVVWVLASVGVILFAWWLHRVALTWTEITDLVLLILLLARIFVWIFA